MRLRVLSLPDAGSGPVVPFVFIIDQASPEVMERPGIGDLVAEGVEGCRGVLCFRQTVEMPQE